MKPWRASTTCPRSCRWPGWAESSRDDTRRSAGGRWTIRREAGRTAVALTAVLALTAGGAWAQFKAAAPGQWKDIVAVAETEGKVVVYNLAVVPVQARIKADFDKLYPRIQLEWIRYASGAAHGQDRPGAPEWPAGADGAISTESGWFSAPTREGQLKLPVGPSLATWPGNLVPYGTSPVLAMDPIVMVYNTNLVKTLMTGHRDTLRPELPGKVGSLDILSSTVVAFYTTLEKTCGADFLGKLEAQRPRIYNSTQGASRAVAADLVCGSPARSVPKQAVPDAQKTRMKRFSVASKPRQPSTAPPRNSAFIEAMMETDSNTMAICSMPAA